MTTALTQISSRTSLWRYAIYGLFLPGSLFALVAVLLGFQAIFGFGEGNEPPTWVLLLTGFAVFAAGGGVWAMALARRAALPNPRRFILAAAISYATMTVLSIVVLGRLEVYFVEEGHSPLPLHNLFTLLFVPAMFISAAVVGGVMGLAAGGKPLAMSLAWRSAVTAALTFLAFNVLQDLLGRRVGGPNAAETATMITVTLICKIAAALAMSAVIGHTLQRENGENNVTSATSETPTSQV